MKTWTTTVHIFVGSFDTVDSARAYSMPQWQPEPSESASDDEYSRWEDNNPVWRFRDDQTGLVELDSDFVELVFGVRWPSYLSSLVAKVNPCLQSTLDAGFNSANCLVVVFEQALRGHLSSLCSTPKLRYLGAHPAILRR